MDGASEPGVIVARTEPRQAGGRLPGSSCAAPARHGRAFLCPDQLPLPHGLRAGACCFAAACLLLLAVLTFPVAASAQTDIWTATLTVGAIGGGGFCSNSTSAGACTSPTGSLSDDDFILDGTTYTVESIRWGRDPSDRLHLTLDRDFPAGSLATLTLEVGSGSFALSAASRGNADGNVDNNYKWSPFPVALVLLRFGNTVTVTLVSSTTVANAAPTVANPIDDQTATAGTAFLYAFPTNTFADTDAGDTLTYTATQSDDSALPAWLTFDAATRTFSGTPQTADVGTVSVKVTASDGTDSVSDTFDIVVSTAANSAPVFADATAARNFTETVGDAAVSTAGDVGAVVTATDADSDTLTYSLEGTDMAKFGIVSGSGQIRTLVGEKYDREAKANYSVTVKADDGKGGTDTIAVTITVDNAVEKPVAPAMPAVTATSGSTTSLDVSWMAPANTGRPAITGYKVEYRAGVSGNWTNHAHTGTGTTATIATLTAATAYQVQVLAVNADGDGAWSSPPGSGTTAANSAPVFAAATTARNFTETVGDAAVSTAGDVGAVVTATDADGSDTLAYSLEGTDMAKFGIVSGSGQIRTLVGEKYDREAKGSYSVTVKADDNHGGTDTIAVTITVDNAVEKPVAPAMPAVTATSGSTTSLDVSWMAPANTGRPAITGYKVEYRAGMSGNWTNHAHTGTGTTATIATLTAATAYQVQVLAVNADGDGAWSSPPGSGTTGTNSAPVFADATTARNFTETVGDAAVSTAGDVGAVVTATDADGSDTLAYSLEGTDMAKFGIVSGSGQIQTLVGEKYDREAKGSYSVTVKADDNHGGTDTIAVTITVDNAVEKPVAPAMPAVTATSGSTTSLDVSWMAPANTGRPAITGYKVEYRAGMSGNWTNHAHTGTGTTATIATLTAATAYQVQVLAVNADGDGAWSSPPGSGTTGTNSAPVFADATTARNFTETVGDAAVSTAGDVGAVVTATDADGSDTLAYSLEGTDMAKFGIVSGSGQIRTLVGEKYDREAKGSYSVTVKADDNHGGTDTIAVTITVDNAVEKPVAPAMPAVTATSGSTTSLDVSWMAPANTGRPAITGYKVEYRAGVSGNWTNHAHTGTGTTATIATLTAATAYQVQVLAVNADGDGAWSSPPGSGTTGTNSAPVFAAATTARNFTETVGDAAVSTAGDVGAVVTATDADGSDTLAYSLEGTDMAKFGIVSGSGQIQTLVGEKYDREAKGSYSVTVKADDNHGGTDTIAVTITVDNAVEKPVAPAMPAVTATSGSTTSLDVSWMAPANTGRPAITGYKVEYRAGMSGNWTNHAHTGTGTTATIATLTAATAYQVQVLAVNADGDGAWSSPPGSGTTAANSAPVFADATTARNFTETVGDAAVSTAGDVGAVVTATDADGSDTLAYSLEGTDMAKFGIVSGSGQIQTLVGEKYDREAKGSYSVTVKADDNHGGTDTIAVTITVDNAVEKPVAPAMPAVTATSGSTTSLDVSWMAPANTGRPAITGYKVEYRAGVSGNWTNHAHTGTGTTATIATLTAATAYQVQVLAVNADGDGAWSSPPGSGTTGTNSAPVFAAATTARNFTETVGDAAVSTAGDVGAVVTATDADGSDTLAYSLEGTDMAKFGIVSGSGQIQTLVGEKYDREAKGSYSVTVKADDNHGGTDTIAVTITVDNAVEKPVAPAMPAVTATSGSTTSLDVSWMAPANTGRPAITGYKVEYRAGMSGNWTNHAHTGTGTTATIATLTAATAYQVQVLAVNADGDGAWSSPPGSGTTGTNSAPVFADATAARNFTETVGDAAVSTAGDVGAVVTATDADGSDTLAYSLEGTDMAKFGIVSGSGQIQTLVGEKYDREAKGSYSVTVKADDNHGGTDTIAVTITVDNAVEKPVAPAMPAVTATSGSTTSLDVSWMAPANTGRPAITGYKVEYRAGMSGNWTNHAHTGTGTTATIATLTAATAYQVQVLAVNADGDGAWSSPPGSGTTGTNSAPVFAAATAARNFTETVGDAAVSTAGDVGAVVTATDADGSDTLAYSLEGTDMAKFGIVSGSGQIQTLVGEKYDREAKGSYSVTVKADDNHGGTDTIAVTITVDNAVEKPVAPAMPAVTATSGSTTSLDVSWMAPANTGRPAITGYKVEYRAGMSGNWTNHAHTGTGTTATIATLTAATAYQVQVLAVNADGDGAWSSPPGSGTTGTNSAPVFADATTARNFTETVGDAAVSTAGDVGAVVTATDADGSDTLAYSLEGTDMAKFGIVSGSGQIQTLVGEKYDREAKGSYSVTVKADDNHGGTDTIAVTITVDNAVEKPVAPAMPAVTATSGSTTSLDVSWMAPANTGRPAITGYKVEYRAGMSGNWTNHAHTGTGTTATIATLTAATAYQVQVLAVNADGDGAWSSPPGSGTTGTNSAPVFADATTARNFTETVGDAAVSTAGDVGAVVTATDADGSDTLAYSLEGTDMAKFGIVSGSGQIRTLVGEKYDREAKGSYSVTVKADDNHGGTDTIAVTITVDNAVEKPVAPAMPAVTATSGSTTSLDVSWMAPANTGRPAITGYKVEYRAGMSGNWTNHAHTGTGTTATIATLTAATAYQVQVLAVNADGDGAWSSPPGSGTTGTNSAPVFADATTARNFTETVGDAAVSTAGDVGAVVTATDADGSDTLAYSLEGTDMAKFGIVSGSGQIQTLVGEKYDREAKGSYSVTVKADDNHGGTDTIAVTITVDNAVEKPVAPAMPAVTATSGSTTSLDVSWMAPANTGRPAITGYKVEYRAGMSGNWTNHAHTGTGTTATIATLTAATAYQVQVLAVNADGDGAWSSPPGSGTTGTNSAPVFAAATTARNFTETVGDAAVSTAGDVGAVVTATDADGSDTLAYSLEGTDMAKFGIVSGSGQIQTLVGEKYDREAKGSYSVTVKADDNHGGTDTIAVTITVDNAVEKPVAPAMPAVTATSGSTTSLDVSWMAPANTGRPAITGYKVEYRAGVSGNWTNHAHTGTGTTATIATLTAATAYQVQVLAVNADGDGAWSSPPGSGTTGTNSAPVFADATTARNFTETVGDAAVSTAGDVGAVVTATDADGSDTLAYSLEGTDMAKFGIVSGSGQIQTLVGEKYDREAKGSYSVTVKADDNHGGTDTIAVTITVDNAVEKPVAPAMPAVTATSGSTTSLDVSWMAPANTGRPAITGYKVEYRAGMSGNWTNHAHTGTGTTATIATLTAATAYQVQVLAVNADGDGAWSSPPGSGTTGTNSAPVFADATTARNFTETVGDAAVSTAGDVGAVVTATDADGSDTLAYSLEGTDMAKFGIVSGSGQIQTLVGEKYDREAKGSYSVTVKADDNHGGTDTIAVTITVDNAVEKPVAPAMPAVTATSGSTTSLDVSWMAPANTGRPAITGYKVEYRAGMSGNWTNHAHTGTGTTATIATLTAATAYQVQVLAVNADGDGAWSSPPGSGTTGTNSAPVFADATTARNFTETVGDAAVSTAGDVGAVVTATDADGSDTLAYSLEGTDMAKFGIVSGSGQIQTLVGEKYDREAKGSYSVTVKADDNHGGTDTIAVTITVDNAVEKPVAPAMPAVTATSGSTTSLDVSWMAPANTGRPAITGYKVEYRAGMSGNWTNHAHTGTGTTATIATLTAATAYQVQVLAVNADGDGAWSSPPGSGTTGTNSAPVFADATTARNFTETVGDAAVSTAGDVGAVVTATDADGSDTLAYSLEGTDMAKFGIVSGSGQIQTLVGEKYDREAKGSYSVTVKADDNHGGTDTIAVTITVDNAVEKPVAPAMPAVTATSGSTTSLDVSWMAPANTGRPAITGYKVEYRAGMSGNWTNHAHTGTGTTATIATLTAATAYQVQVLAVNADGDGAWSSPPGSGTTGTNSAPVFADATTARNFTETVGDAAVSTAGDVGAVVTATDADGSDTLAYSLEGTDMAKFGIVSGSGQIQTLVGEKYDREAKGSYSVTVKADDNHGGTDTIAVTITVDNAVEKPVAPAMPAVTATSGSTTSLDVSWMAPANTGRPAITGYKVEYRAGMSGNWTNHAHTGTGTTATIATLTAATAYQVQVLAVNADGDGAWSSPPGSGTTGTNSAPVFADATTARNFTETVGDAAVSTAGDVGAVVTATDADGSDTLAYSLEGTDMAKFGIVSGSGQIQTLVGEKYDREAKGSYSVTVKADDNHGGTDTIAVTITVDNAVEKPVAPAMPAVTATSGSTTSLDVSWMAPANTGRPAITGYKVEYRAGMSGNWTNHAHTGTGTTATIATLTAATAYQVQVLAVNADGDGAWSSPPGSGTTGTNSAPTSADGPVEADEDFDYTFSSDDFAFTDTDTGDSLASVKIVTLPASGTGTLTLSGTAIGSGDLPKTVLAAEIGSLKYSPPANLYGTDVASFTFKVNDGTVDSDNAYTITIDVKGENDSATGAPTITGTAQVGETLTAVTTGIMDADGLTSVTYTYQWIRANGTEADIASANSSTYILVAADLGKTIKVKVSFEDDDSTAETLTSAATATVVAAPTAPMVTDVDVTSTPASGDTYGTGEMILFTVTFDQAVTVTGTPEFEFCLGSSSTMSCSVGTPPPALRSAAYESGTGTTMLVFSYTVVAGDVDDNGIWIGNQNDTIKLETGDTIQGTVGGLDAVLTHDEVGPKTDHKVNGATGNIPATGAPTITGTAQVGQTLTASITGIADANGLTNVSYMYQWLRVETDNTAADIASANSSTYTLDAADLGKTIKVKVSFTDDADNTETLTSAAYPSSGTVTAAGTNTAQVTEVMVASGNARLVVNWEAVPNATGYKVQWKSGSQGYNNGNRQATVDSGTTTNHTITGLTNGTEYTVRVTATRSGANDGPPSAEVMETPAVPTTAGVTVSTMALMVTEENTTGDTYTVVLDTQPTADVTVTVAGHTGTEVTLTPSSGTLTFTTANWNTAQTVTVTAGNDTDTENDTVTLTHSATSTDSSYNAIAIGSVVVTVTDNDVVRPPPPPPTNTPPVVAIPPVDQEATTGDVFTYVIPEDAFTDADGNPLAYTAALSDGGMLPSWLTFDPATRTFTGTPGPGDSGTVRVTVMVSDGTATVSDEFALTVTVTNTAPTAADKTVTTAEDTAYTFTAADFGFDDDDAGATLASVKIVTVPVLGILALDGTAVTVNAVVTKAQIDGNMLIFTPARDAHGDPYTTFTFTVNDGTDDSASAYTMTIDVTVDRDPPGLATTNGATVSGDTLTLVYDEPLDEKSVPAASAYTVTATVGTTTTNPAVTEVSVRGSRVTATVGTTTTNPAVTEVSVRGSRVTLTLDPAPAAGATLTYMVPMLNPVQDVAGNDAPGFSGRPVTRRVPPPPPTNTPPVVAIPPVDQEATTGDVFTYVIPADAFTDADGNPLAYTAALSDGGRLPSWLTFDPATRTFTGTPGPGDGGTVRVTVMVSDGTATVSDEFVLMVMQGNTSPVVAIPLADQEVMIDVPFTYVVPADAFTDADGNPLTYTAALSGGGMLPSWLVFDPATRTFTGTPGPGDSGTVFVTVTASDGTTPVSDEFALRVHMVAPSTLQAWTSRFGRTVATHVTDAVGERLRASPEQDSQVTVGGYRLPLGRQAAGGADPETTTDPETTDPETTTAPKTATDRLASLLTGLVGRALGLGPAQPQGGGTGTDPWAEQPAADPRLGQSQTLQLPTVRLRDVLLGSSFRLTLGDADASPGHMRLTAWGRVAGTQFDGRDGALTLDGNVLTGTVGVDSAWDRWLAGVAVSHSLGGGSFTGDGDGDLDSSTLTSIHPYLRYAVNERVDVWSVLGYGWGDMTLEPGTGGTLETDTTLLMGSFGGRGILLSAPDNAGFQLATRTDAMLTRTTSGAVAGLAETEADAHRLRLVLEGTRPVLWPEGQSVTPTVELGVRHDWGDAETGFGLELGGRVQYADPTLGLTIEAAVRGLLTHEDSDYKEWGASGTIRIAPDPNGQGLSLTLAPTWGAASSGIESLWSRQTTAGLAQTTGPRPTTSLNAEMGYGVAAPFGPGLLTPYAGALLSDGTAHSYRLGTRWTSVSGLTLNVEGTRQDQAGQPPTQGLQFQVTWGF